jgi:carboxyl-terminal processing protease
MGRAVEMFRRAGARGVIIDMRGNPGGPDKLAARLMGFFLTTRRFYESATQFNDASGRFERVPGETLWIEPRPPTFDGPLALLIDEYCISSCEGLALIAQSRPSAHVIGVHGSHGSFGMSGAQILMPGSLIVEYPDGQSLDARGVVQIDSDAELRGGIEPDVRVPVTLENVNARNNEHRDVVLEQAMRTLTGD